MTHAQDMVGQACPVAMRLLVIAADGSEPGLTAIRQTLDYLGTPYKVYIALEHPGGLTPAILSYGCLGFYQGVILTTGELGYASPTGWTSALTLAEFDALNQYEMAFGIRQVTWYTYPSPTFGFNWPTAATSDPVTASFTAKGVSVFSYINAANPLKIQNAYTYLATPLDGNTVPLVVDGAGHALAAVKTYGDGRENLALTFDGSKYLLHSVALGYGLINWVTRGLFVGERHIYMSPQVDDVLISDDEWRAGLPCTTPANDTGFTRRITAADLNAVVNWQNLLRTKTQTKNVRLTFAFNGFGAAGNDDLTTAARKNRKSFYWISHTFSHFNLDALTKAEADQEILKNITAAEKQLLLDASVFDRQSMVTPEVSGLRNPDFLQSAYDRGIRYLVTDTSKPGYDNPSPNIAIPNPILPGILMVPRRANNLYYNVATPDGWAGEYNCRYNTFWQRDLSYQEILNVESDTLMGYLVRGDADPWMFHQTNLAAYDGANTLLTDLINLTLGKYNSLYKLPILSPQMREVGEFMNARQQFNDAKVTAVLNPGRSISLLAAAAATVPITGLNSAQAELYGGQYIAHVDLKAGRPVVLSLR